MEKQKRTELVQKKENKPSKEEIEAAKEGFEYLAQRLDELWMKPQLTEKEQKEVELILNNAAVIQDIIEGIIPEELQNNE